MTKLAIDTLRAAVAHTSNPECLARGVDAREERAIACSDGRRPRGKAPALMLASLCLVPACSAQPANRTAQARPRERCADVEKDRARFRADMMRRVRAMQAQEGLEEPYPRNGLRKSGQFVQLQQDIEAGEHRLQLRLAECSGS